jgi:hypothetical protein
MDRRHLESCPRLHKNQPGLQTLLRRNIRRAFSGSEGPPLRAGIPTASRPRKACRTFTLAATQNDFCELHERFVSRLRFGRLHYCCRSRHGKANWHTYQVLTKRSDRLCNLLNSKLRFAAKQPHIWWGVSVEDKKYGVPSITDLQAAGAAVRFLSVEPLLEDIQQLNLRGIDWMIVGGESGAGARPMKKEWVLSLREQCSKSKVAFFFKQWGGVRKAKTGRRLEGKTYNEFPERVHHPVMRSEDCSRLASEIESRYTSKTLPLSSLLVPLNPVAI